MPVTVAVPAVDMLTVPVLRNTSGVTQHAPPCIVEPGDSVRVPVLVTAGPESWINSTPGPLISVVPSKVIGSWLSSLPAPLKDASPCTVSGAARVALSWLTLHEKLPATVTLPPDSDELVSVRSCNCIPAGMPVTSGVGSVAVGAMMTLSPFCGTSLLTQF